MNITKIKDFINQNLNCVYFFRYKGVRNQNEEFYGKILKTYNSIFTVIDLDHTHRIKAFSYSDVLTNILEFERKKI